MLTSCEAAVGWGLGRVSAEEVRSVGNCWLAEPLADVSPSLNSQQRVGVPGPFYTIFLEEGTLEVCFCSQYLLCPLGSEPTASPGVLLINFTRSRRAYPVAGTASQHFHSALR